MDLGYVEHKTASWLSMGNKVMQEVELRTGVWYNDTLIKLTFPDSWDVVTHWPDTPPPLTSNEIEEKTNLSIGQPSLRELAKGKKRPVIIVDDLTRPTPVFKIMPFLLEQFNSAHIPPNNIRILIATGTHGDQDKRALSNKIGKEAAESCRVIIHNDQRDTRFVGKTSFGTPVYVNSELIDSDLIVGVGGVYPHHTVGFGGGAKLALGVLGRRSITHLHYTHRGVGGTYDINNNFRKDLTEIGRMINLNTIYTLHVNAYLEFVNLMCGDHLIYYPQAAQFSKQRFSAPVPEDADVVIANAYPFDLSLTFMRKGYKPLDLAPRSATKIMIASVHEGIGTHGLFQHISPPRLLRYRTLYRKISLLGLKTIIYKIVKHLTSVKRSKSNTSEENYVLPMNTDHLWLYRPRTQTPLIHPIKGITVTTTWDEILKAIVREQSSKGKIRVRIYPCAPLQCLEDEMVSPKT